ncbi:unnamed protein product [Pleuronectes platessa]|uniref:Uncharacterized protein n=1 Tax=Pleuronectes platessa TaxID=8262 RepID=A0A9N7U3A3_PLEPL|nr:unnamed protein product [Pleuronectes platessa]
METQGKSPLACPCLLCAHATAALRSHWKPDESQSCHYGRWNVLSPGRAQPRATRGNGAPCQPRVTECLVTRENQRVTLTGVSRPSHASPSLARSPAAWPPADN